MTTDRSGATVVFVVYDLNRKTPGGGWWRVATFRHEENAEAYLRENQNPHLFISCGTATVRDLSLARD